MVADPLPLRAAGRDAAGAELRGRGAARGVRPEAGKKVGKTRWPDRKWPDRRSGICDLALWVSGDLRRQPALFWSSAFCGSMLPAGLLTWLPKGISRVWLQLLCRPVVMR